MLMVVDIGNTNIVVGLFHGGDLAQDWRIYTDPRRTDDEYSSILRSLFRDSGIAPGTIEKTVISSVVPVLNETFAAMIEKLTGKKPILIGPALYPRLPVTVPESATHEIGSDLVCDAVAAWDWARSACIVVDFGTALTFTAVDSSAMIRGVAIAPGLNTAVKALFRDTAQLPSVPVEVPPSSLGTNTIHSIQAGVVLGYQGLVESLVSRMKSELGSDARVVATGGLSHVLAPVTKAFDAVDPMLTLKGLRLIAEMV
ncbi:MAG TPA: type III pantothenate kinase [Treponemataceae bacterium]|jgi:type III pantothenate kinase|nr:type III pantothenate kinase [Treponemataceae bacterium]